MSIKFILLLNLPILPNYLKLITCFTPLILGFSLNLILSCQAAYNCPAQVAVEVWSIHIHINTPLLFGRCVLHPLFTRHAPGRLSIAHVICSHLYLLPSVVCVSEIYNLIIYVLCVRGGRCVVTSSLPYPAAVCTSEWLVVIHYTTSIFSGPTSSDAHTPINIDSHPTLEHVSKFIVYEVAADWQQVATFLSV